MGTATLYSNNKIHVIIPQESVPRTLCIKDRLSEEADGSALLVALTAASSVK